MKTVIISLGGSMIVPEQINVDFLRDFKECILSFVDGGNRAVIVAGGGHTARVYQEAAKEVSSVGELDLDWVGIRATKINAELLRSVFGSVAYEAVIDNPTESIDTDKNVIIGSGWQPGCSSDKDAVLLAENFKADTVINITNVDYVYDKNPKEFSDAKPLPELSWAEMRSLVGDKWEAGANLPFDPIASKDAERLGLTVVIVGSDLDNLKNLLNEATFKGTTIKP